MRILAVDDSQLVRDMLPTLFRNTAYPPLRIVDSAGSALELLNDPSAEFDCLILDIEMPGMDGIELCARIRQMPRYHDTPIIMLTARSDGASIERAFAAGANDYIIKRFEMKVFTSRVHIAERFLNREGASLSLNPDALPKNGIPGQHHFDITQGFRILGVDRMILPFSLGNYLAQLPTEELATCQIFAVQMKRIEDIFAGSNSRDLVRALADVAHAISDEIKSTRMLTAYVGGGTFMCVTRGVELPLFTDLECNLLAKLAGTVLLSKEGVPIPTEIRVGRPVAPSGYRTQRVRKSFSRAQERVHAR